MWVSSNNCGLLARLLEPTGIGGKGAVQQWFNGSEPPYLSAVEGEVFAKMMDLFT